MKMLVAGAGLVGCAQAIMLKQQGFDVTLLEKRADPRAESSQGGRSINLIITAKAINLFKNLNIWNSVRTITVPVYGRMMHSIQGDLTYQPYGMDDSEYNHSVSRSMLNNLLLDEAEQAGVTIVFEQGIDSVDFVGKKIIFHENTYEYDKLFGCDGAGSQVREAILKVKGDRATYRVEPLGVDYKEFLMPANEKGEYPIDKKSLHIWPRGKHFLMALPNLKGSFTMTLYMPTEWFENFDMPEKVEAYFKEYYPDSLPHMPDYLKEYGQNPQGFLGTVRMSDWVFEDSVFLMGDAAHAIVPFFGQGMNCGMSDVEFIRSQMESDVDWSTIAKNYQDNQKPNGDAIADLSLDNFVEMSERVGDEEFLLKKQVENKLENEFPEKYRSRYGMTVYTLIPYHHALAAGEIQQEILAELTRDIESADDVDLAKAEKLIDGLLVPWLSKRNISLEKFPIE